MKIAQTDSILLPYRSSAYLLRILIKKSGTPVNKLWGAVISAIFAVSFEFITLLILSQILYQLTQSTISTSSPPSLLNLLGGRLGIEFSFSISALTSLIFVSSAGKCFFVFLGQTFTSGFQTLLQMNLREQVVQRYLYLGTTFFDRIGLGHAQALLTQFTRDVGIVIGNSYRAFIAAGLIGVYVTTIVLISWKLALLLAVLLPLTTFTLSYWHKKIKTFSTETAALVRDSQRKIHNILSNIPLIHFSSMASTELSQFKGINSVLRESQFRIEKSYSLAILLQELSTLIALVIVLLTMNAILLGAGYSFSSEHLVFFLLIQRSANGFNHLMGFRHELFGVHGQLKEVSSLLLQKSPEAEGKEQKKFLGIKDAITIHHLNFSYTGRSEVLQDISFQIKPKKVTVLCGPSGAGKSTLVNLLLRLYECPKGSILIDGEDINSFSVESFREKISVVSQEIWIFHATLRENLVYGSLNEYSSQTLWSVLEKVQLDKLVKSLPQGLETMIGDRGLQLSGGEKQKLSIARALLKKADLVFLDEAMSALDPVTDRYLQDFLYQSKEQTILAISHRVSSILRADWVVFIENGTVTEQGSPADLLNRSEKFQTFCQQDPAYSALPPKLSRLRNVATTP